MEILGAFDLTGSYRNAGELAGCSHHTVAGDRGFSPVLISEIPQVIGWVGRG